MGDLIRDTIFGATLRLLTGNRVFAWPDDKDEALRQRYLSASQQSDLSSEDVAKAEAGKDATMIEYLDNDPHNPLNWSLKKKTFVTFNICFLTTSVYIGSAIYTAGLREIQQVFDISQTMAILGLTLYVLGYGLGPMLWAPLSEVPFFGRNPVYLGTLTVFVALNFAVVYAKNAAMLLAFRFLTGLFGSPVLATGGASIADLFKPSKRPYALAVYGIANVLGPVLGPLCGGFAAQFKGWQWTIWELIWLSGTCLVWLLLTLPETSAANILYRRTCRLRTHLPPSTTLTCAPELEALEMTPREGIMMVLIRPFTLTFTEPIILVLNSYIALVYALLYLWLESIPLVFETRYHFSLGLTGVAYCGILVGALITVPVFYIYYYYRVEPQFDSNGELTPEARMPLACVGAFCLPICLFIFAWTSRPDIHWIVPIIGTGFFSVGAFCLFMAVLTYLGDAYPRYIASVYAGNDLFRSIVGACFPLFANALFSKLGVGWGNSLLGFISIAFIPAPFVIWRYGRAIRLRSKAARHDI